MALLQHNGSIKAASRTGNRLSSADKGDVPNAHPRLDKMWQLPGRMLIELPVKSTAKPVGTLLVLGSRKPVPLSGRCLHAAMLGTWQDCRPTVILKDIKGLGHADPAGLAAGACIAPPGCKAEKQAVPGTPLRHWCSGRRQGLALPRWDSHAQQVW